MVLKSKLILIPSCDRDKARSIMSSVWKNMFFAYVLLLLLAAIYLRRSLREFNHVKVSGHGLIKLVRCLYRLCNLKSLKSFTGPNHDKSRGIVLKNKLNNKPSFNRDWELSISSSICGEQVLAPLCVSVVKYTHSFVAVPVDLLTLSSAVPLWRTPNRFKTWFHQVLGFPDSA